MFQSGLLRHYWRLSVAPPVDNLSGNDNQIHRTPVVTLNEKSERQVKKLHIYYL